MENARQSLWMVAHIVPLQQIVGFAVSGYSCASSKNLVLLLSGRPRADLVCGSSFEVISMAVKILMNCQFW